MTKPTGAEIDAAKSAVADIPVGDHYWLNPDETDELARAALTAAAQVRAQAKAKNCAHPRRHGTGCLGSDGSSHSTWYCPYCAASGSITVPPRSDPGALGTRKGE